jgi:hypothetical protein
MWGRQLYIDALVDTSMKVIYNALLRRAEKVKASPISMSKRTLDNLVVLRSRDQAL